jgi:copper resistance protein C
MKHIIFSFILILLTGSARLEAHAFLKDANPGAGGTVQTSPSEVRIRFTENIEPAVSSIRVFDASGKEVDKRDLHLDRSDHALLHVSLPPLGAGTYKVAWRVVSVDTHVTSGNFTFRVVR